MKRAKVILLIFLVLMGCVLLFWKDLLILSLDLSLKLRDVKSLSRLENLPDIKKQITDFLEKENQNQISIPEPIRASQEAPQSFLTQEGVIRLTNVQRQEYNLASLKENTKLDLMAQMKARDMFKNQYFAHDSLSGAGVADLAESAGYDYILIGENLALGNFENDEVLVQAWMDSKGHRENILNSRYEEIGVAVEKGIFEGKSTWIAVQHFGLPISACPQPQESLVLEIQENQDELARLKVYLDALSLEIENMKPKSTAERIQKMEEYNNLVAQYNNLAFKTKALIEEYNSQTALFNKCIVGSQ